MCPGGAEIVTVTDLPGPVYPDLADPYHNDPDIPGLSTQTSLIRTTVNDLPGLVYPDLADPYHCERPIRPCLPRPR